MVELIRGLRVERVRENLDRVREEITAAGRELAEVQILAAVKYLDADELPVLAEAGVTLLGENRAQELERKAAAYPGTFTWDFIGQLQSRKVRTLLPLVRLIHSVASDSALAQLERHADPNVEVLVEVNLAGEASKSGVAPDELDAFLDRCPVRVAGLMTMPPRATRPEDSRRYFAALRELGAARGLRELSMGTTQDYTEALREGATIIRLGSTLFG
jgi:pyridoxal phosphate enzyme (YggS family)